MEKLSGPDQNDLKVLHILTWEDSQSDFFLAFNNVFYFSLSADCFAGQGALPEVPQWAQTLWREGISVHSFGENLTWMKPEVTQEYVGYMGDSFVLNWILNVVTLTHYIARGETDRCDAAGGATLRHQSCHQHPNEPGGPFGWFQPRQPHWNPHRGWHQRPAWATCAGC